MITPWLIVILLLVICSVISNFRDVAGVSAVCWALYALIVAVLTGAHIGG